ncbi:DUF5996 family protein [Streptomyces xiangluensis]|uniref:DUF5996 family protein n=1 Tax=Streptomyces xiangluensis TaxID=2665720 RepID=A0ABV8YL62_9ACTN
MRRLRRPNRDSPTRSGPPDHQAAGPPGHQAAGPPEGPVVGEAEAPLAPGSAEWVARRGSHPAVLRYDAARAVAHPRAAVLTFYDSAYQAAAAGRADWDVAGLACSGGTTDQHLAALPPDRPWWRANARGRSRAAGAALPVSCSTSCSYAPGHQRWRRVHLPRIPRMVARHGCCFTRIPRPTRRYAPQTASRTVRDHRFPGPVRRPHAEGGP